MISIGAVIGGPECAFFDSRLRRLMRYCRENRDKGTETAEVNVVFHLPGSVIRPNYVGLRTAKFSKKEKTLMVQVSVEEEWITSTDEKTVLRYIYETTDEALGLALGEFKRRGIEYDIEVDRRFLATWKELEGFQSYLDSCGKKTVE